MPEPQAPRGSLNESETQHLKFVKEWCIDALSEGEAFLKAQKGYNQISTAMDYIMGDYSRDLSPGAFSKLVDNRTGKIALDFASAMTDIKPFWEYHTYNSRFDTIAEMGGKITKHWWTSRLIDLKFADCIKYAEVAGSGTHTLSTRSNWATSTASPKTRATSSLCARLTMSPSKMHSGSSSGVSARSITSKLSTHVGPP